MRSETIAIHAGYEPDPITKSVAVPIYQPRPTPSTAPITAPLCSTWKRKAIAAAGFSNPTTSALEKRITELEGGVGALAVASGQAAYFELVQKYLNGNAVVAVHRRHHQGRHGGRQELL